MAVISRFKTNTELHCKTVYIHCIKTKILNLNKTFQNKNGKNQLARWSNNYEILNLWLKYHHQEQGWALSHCKRMYLPFQLYHRCRTSASRFELLALLSGNKEILNFNSWGMGDQRRAGGGEAGSLKKV
jgi:hypothetical protein